jgi:signal transduction histidine kinase
MEEKPGFFSRLGSEMLKLRWFIMAAIGLFALCLEISERLQFNDLRLDFPFVFEAFLEGVGLPILGGILLSLANQAILDRSEAVYQLSRKEALTQAIDNAQNWSELLATIVEFPRGIVPLVGSVLLVFEPNTNQFKPEAFWGLYGVNPEVFKSCHPASICQTCILNRPSKPLKQCQCDHDVPSSDETIRHCLPLSRGGQLVALLHLYLPGWVNLDEVQLKMLSGLAPEMALAIDDARTKRLHTMMKANSDQELKQIARDLHDNLAQNLVFVRHKLDELTGADALQEISSLRHDLERMREVVDDAYMDVRNTLKKLEASVSADLPTLLRDYAYLIEDRGDLHFQFTTIGQPTPIASRLARQVLSIFGEIITNIEKHASAQSVDVQVTWENDFLTMVVKDDGSGFDYHGSNGYHKNGHMGLTIMHERAAEIHGKLTIRSEVGSGTEVSLRLPLNPELIEHAQFA